MKKKFTYEKGYFLDADEDYIIWVLEKICEEEEPGFGKCKGDYEVVIEIRKSKQVGKKK